MNRCTYLVLITFIFSLWSCKETPVVNSLSSFQSLDSVSVFAPELSLSGNTFKGSFSDDFNTFYFFRKKAPNQEIYIPYQSTFDGKKWSEPSISSYFDTSNSYTYQLKVPLTNTLIFLSDKRTQIDTTSNPNYNFWYTEIIKDSFSTPRELGLKSLVYNYNSQPSIVDNGTIFFTSDTADWSKTLSYKSTLLNGKYQTPVLFEPINKLRENKDWNVYEFAMSPKEDFMIICIEDKSEEKPNVDLYISFKETDQWSIPRKLGPSVNTDATENFPVITRDGSYLIFTRAFSSFHIVPIDLLKRSMDQ